MSKAYQIVEKASWKEIDGMIVVVNTESGAYYALNKTASEIWRRIAEGKNKEEVRTEMEAKYDIGPETIVADLDSSLVEWLQEGLVIEK